MELQKGDIINESFETYVTDAGETVKVYFETKIKKIEKMPQVEEKVVNALFEANEETKIEAQDNPDIINSGSPEETEAKIINRTAAKFITKLRESGLGFSADTEEVEKVNLPETNKDES